MKKSNVVAMMLGTVSGVFFAVGMCMALIPEWNAMQPGIIFGVIGLVLGLVTLIIWRKMENKAPIKINGRIAAFTLLGIIGALLLGVGMCFCMVWNNFILGTIIGIFGIFMLVALIPIVKGIK